MDYTSVFGGCEDVEFIEHSRRLVAAMTNGDYAMVISEVTLLELEKAPVAVREHLERIPEALVEVLALDFEAEELAGQYILDGAVGKNERADALHIALATAARVDVLVSWHFKHIVNLRRIQVRDNLNREIEATTGKQLLDHVHGHRYTSPFLQRLASKATSKADASGTASASN